MFLLFYLNEPFWAMYSNVINCNGNKMRCTESKDTLMPCFYTSKLLRLSGTYDTEESRSCDGGAGEHPAAGAGAGAAPHLPHLSLPQINLSP